ncbi:MAG: hypothetical protein IKS11_05210 [Lachnospiraceae bacterium]|nr:hypothetical protein [Lachnospiraceae bacterium]
MAKISKEDFDKIASLSKLSFSEEERERFTADLEQLTEFAKSVNTALCDETDAEGREPGKAEELTLEGLREDVTASSLSNSAALQNANGTDGYFKVNRVI